MPTAVVIGLDCMTGLQTARILSRHGIPIVGIAEDTSHPCCRTNTCSKIVRADIAHGELVQVLRNLGPALGERAVLYPCTDLSVLLISRARRELENWYHVVLPAPDVVELLIDKARFLAYAKEEKLPIPGTFLLRE